MYDRRLWWVLLLAFGMPAGAGAVPPVSQGYQPNASTNVPDVKLGIDGWIDETDATIYATGSPHPVSQSKPLPVQVISGSSSNAPASAAVVPCQGGTGSVISAVTTMPATVCAAATTRSYVSVVSNTGASGSIVAVGTFDGTTPSSTHYNFVLYGGLGWDSSGFGSVPIAAIQVVSLSGSVTITAGAIQTGAAP